MNIAKIVSLLTLLLVIVPSLLYFGGLIDLNTVKVLALVGTIAWFISTPLWMSRKLDIDATQVEI